MAERTTKVAVVGAGFIAEFHLEILRQTPLVELVCVVDGERERARSAARRWGVPHSAASVAELERGAVDVAHVLVPPAAHAAVARALLERGIGAFVEKPLVLSASEARELAELARARGAVLAVNHNACFHPTFVRLRERVQRGEIGRVEHVRALLSVPLRQLDSGDTSHWMFRQARNIVFEQAPHPLAQVAALAGRAREVHARVLSLRKLGTGQDFCDRWLIAARAERATVEIYLAFGQSFSRNTLEVLGSDGALTADLLHESLWGERKTQWLDFANSFLATRRAGAALRREAWRNLANYAGFTLGLAPRRDAFFVGMRDSIQAFHRALREGQPPPAGAREAELVLDWCERVASAAPADPCPASEPAAQAGARPARREGEVVVLGGSGFIGTRVVERLVARGVPVAALVRRTHTLPEVLRHPSVRWIEGRLEDPAGFAGELAGARALVHLATGSGSSWEAIEKAMVQGSAELLEQAVAGGVKRFVYVSSIAALYLGPDAPAELEDSPETDPRAHERALYARGKARAEQELFARARAKGLPLVVARPGVVLGAGTPLQHSGLGLWVRDNHCVGWGLGRTPLPLVLADDVAEALVRIALHPTDELHGRALNLAADTGLSARDIVAELKRATGRDLAFHPRRLWWSQTLEIGKWLVKRAGRRKGAVFPSWRDLKSRALAPKLTCRTAREVLGWIPIEERSAFLERAVRIHAPRSEP
jgi:predicted dehydrogenase/nucleoside-diphosphate-sugar epimerase